MANGRIVVNETLCKSCGLCIEACPKSVIKLADYLNNSGYRPAVYYDPGFLCTGCALCAVVCPDVAITVYRDLPLMEAQRGLVEAV